MFDVMHGWDDGVVRVRSISSRKGGALPVLFSNFRLLTLLLLLVVGSLSATTVASAKEIVQLRESMNRWSLSSHVQILTDPTSSLSFADVQLADRFARFQPNESPLINYGVTGETYWFRFELNNPTENPLPFILHLEYPLLDLADLYWEGDNNEMQVFKAGDTLPFEQRQLSLPHFAYPIEIDRRTTQVFYLKVQTSSNLILPLYISTRDEYLGTHAKGQWFLGVFYGIGFGLMLYNLFLFASIRESTYLYYVLYVFFSIVFNFSVDGLSFQFFPDSLYWQEKSPMIGILLADLFALMFSRRYLSLWESKKWVNTLNLGMMPLCFILLLCVPFVDSLLMAELTLIYTFFQVTMLFLFGIIRLFERYVPAKIYVIAWGVLLSSAAITVLATLGIVTNMTVALVGSKVGLITELILLSFGLASRINLLKDQQLETRREAITALAQSKAKTDFLAKMSHEIRTPINGVLGMTQLLQETGLEERQKEYLKTLKNSGTALLDIINDILDYSKIEAGKLEIESITFDLEELLEESISVFEYKFKEKGLDFLCVIHCDTPIKVTADPSRIRQVILNCLSNAIKFTSQGQIILKVSPITDIEHQKTYLRFDIEDSGIGISPAKQKLLFRSFQQGDIAISRQYGGTGLGLVISKQLTAMMGGKIGVDSVEGLGSSFWFTVEIPERALLRDRSEYADHHVMIGHENERILEVLHEHFSAIGVAVTKTQQTKDIAELFKKRTLIHTFDAVLLSQNLCLGLSWVIAKSKSKAKLVILTPRHLSQPKRLQALGELYVATRPISITGFCQRLLKTIDDTSTEVMESQPKGGQWVDAQGQSELANIRILVVEDNEINRIVISGLLGIAGIPANIVHNGLQAVAELEANYDAYDLVLMDCNMPVMDGYEATRRIRAFEQRDGLGRKPIIALTAHAGAGLESRSRDSGMDDHLAKPVDSEVLYSKLQYWYKEQGRPGFAEESRSTEPIDEDLLTD